MPCSGARDRLSDGSEGRDRQIHEMILLNAHGKLPPQQAGRADAALAEMSVHFTWHTTGKAPPKNQPGRNRDVHLRNDRRISREEPLSVFRLSRSL